MKVLLFQILFFHHVNLYVSDTFSYDLIKKIKIEAKEVYGVRVSYSHTLHEPRERMWGYEAEDFVDSIDYHGHGRNRLALTKHRIGRLYFIFDSDICTGIIPLFGTTYGRMSVISAADDSTDDFTVSTILHELGHQLGLSHCDEDGGCLMAPGGPNNSLYLCKSCRKKYRHVRSFAK